LALLNTFLQRAKTKLLQLPAQSQSAKGQLENQKKGIEAALADGRGSEVYLLTLDMERALENLADAVDETREIDLLNDLDQLWQEAFKTNKTLAEQQAKLLELQTQQALSKSNLRTDELERKQKILQALDNDQPS